MQHYDYFLSILVALFDLGGTMITADFNLSQCGHLPFNIYSQHFIITALGISSLLSSCILMFVIFILFT